MSQNNQFSSTQANIRRNVENNDPYNTVDKIYAKQAGYFIFSYNYILYCLSRDVKIP